MEFLPKAFEPLAEYPQFVVYEITPSASRPGKFDKVPIDPVTGAKLKWGVRENLLDAETAISAATLCGENHGVGFVFTENDPFWFLDIDSSLSLCNTAWSEIGNTLCAAFPGAAVEISNSRRGLHIIGSGRIGAHNCKNKDLNIEFYTEGRFAALTGIGAMGSVAADFTEKLPWLVSTYFPGGAGGALASGDLWERWDAQIKRGVEPAWDGETDDEALLATMLRATGTATLFQGKATFSDLWNCNVDVLAANYPDTERNEFPYNASSVDAALALRLAYWTGNDCLRMERLMLRSALIREKWDRKDYLPRTILDACGKQKEWNIKKRKAEVSTSSKSGQLRVVEGSRLYGREEQIQHFAGCVYVHELKKILHKGHEYSKSQFNAVFGGRSFTMDNENGRIVRDAWEAFTESQLIEHPKVHYSIFNPTIAPGSIVNIEGDLAVNCYWPVDIRRVKGDAGRFLKHLRKILSTERDAIILLSFMAAIVQYKGVKFGWCPFIQGVDGNGKSLISQCVQYAVGEKYTHYPRAIEISNKFNSWTYKKLFVAVEDLEDGNREVFGSLKPLITNTRHAVEPKGVDAATRGICCNFIINANPKNGIHKYRDDRRIAPFFANQQSAEDLKRDGLTEEYFCELFAWLNKDGYAIVADLLETYDIPDEFNPATHCKRAPITSSTEDAIFHGLTVVEQEILEAIEEGRLGFKGGWISSFALDILLKEIKANGRIPINKRKDVLKTLGYIWHPGLKEGRVNNLIIPDGGKPRLFIKIGHEACNIVGPSEIARAYTEAQAT